MASDALKLYIFHYPDPDGSHDYYARVGSPEDIKEMESKPIASQSIDFLRPKAREFLRKHYKNNEQSAYSGPEKFARPTPIGAIRLRSINHDGKIGFSFVHYPLACIPYADRQDTRGARLGRKIEEMCLKHFVKNQEITHMTTSDKVMEMLKHGTIHDAGNIDPNTLSKITTNRRRQLENLGIPTEEIVPAKEWIRKIRSASPLGTFASMTRTKQRRRVAKTR